jgi:hypothetical protein
MAKKKLKPVLLSPNQIGHLIWGTVKNLVDLSIHADVDGARFLLILECVSPKDCIPANQEPKSDQEKLDITGAHTVLELMDYFEAIVSVKHEDGKYYRGFSTIAIDLDNMADFVDSLRELEDYWAEIDQELENEENLKSKIEGKNIVAGNNTVN